MIRKLLPYQSVIKPFWRVWNTAKARALSYPAESAGYKPLSRQVMINYNSIRYHGAKRQFCYNPFVNVFFDIEGKAVACCRSHENVLGRYPDQSIRDIWFGQQAENMREHMRNNDLHMGCSFCLHQVRSGRFQGLPSMHADRYAHSQSGEYPRIMELELSNVCNLECIMCSGRESSVIRKKREQKPPLKSPYDKEFVHQLDEFIPHLREMHFYGGEPFLIDLYYDIWEKIRVQNPRMRLFTVTNGTIFNQRIEKLLRDLKMTLTLSVDSLDKDRFEHIRRGSDFNRVMQNIEAFSALSYDHLVISHTPMTLNWQDTPDILRFCNDHAYRLNLSFVERPVEYALWAQHPDELKAMLDNYRQGIKQTGKNSAAAAFNNQVFREWLQQLAFYEQHNRETVTKADSALASSEQLKKSVYDLLIKHFPASDGKMDGEKLFSLITEEDKLCQYDVIGRAAMSNMLGFLQQKEIDTDIQNVNALRNSLKALYAPHRFFEEAY